MGDANVVTLLDWVIIGAYLAFALAVGVVFARRAGSSTDEFFISGRNLPWWLAGTSMVATSFASDTPLVITGWVREGGISENWLWWSFGIGHMLSVFLLARLWRRARVVTDVELTELRYSGRSAAVLRGFRAAYLAIPINCCSMAWVMVAMIKLLGVLFDVDPLEALVVCVALATFYSVLAGFWGVVVTDLVQFIIAMVGSVCLCVLAVRSCGGLVSLVDQVNSSASGDRALAFFPTLGEADGGGDQPWWSGPVFAFVVLISVQWWANKNADGGGVVVQRMSATRDERHSMLATLWFAVAHYALRPWPWILVALASLVALPDMADGEAAYPEMIKRFMPPGLMGLMLVSFLAAFMSTIDTHVNLSTSYMVNDVYQRFVAPGASQRHLVWVSRGLSVVFVLISSVIAWQSQSISGLFKFVLAFSSGVGSVYILRWFWWRINAWSELSAMIASAAIASGLYICAKWMPYPLILLITVAGSTVVWLTVTFLTHAVSTDHLVAFYDRVRPCGAWGPIARASRTTRPLRPWRQVVTWLAGTVMVLGALLATGKFLLGAAGEGVWYAAAALAGLAVIWPELSKREPAN